MHRNRGSLLKVVLVFGFILALVWVFGSKSGREVINEKIHNGASPFYDFIALDIEGRKIDFSSFKNKVVLIVNVASECGFTEQNYKQLTSLHDQYHSKGLQIVAFPCNQFGQQEPGTNKEIQLFAKAKYRAGFLLMDKVEVKGPRAHPLWKWLQAQTTSEIRWNFFKFLINGKGDIVTRYDSSFKPIIEQDIQKHLRALSS